MEAQSLSQKQGALVAILQLGGYVREIEPIVSHMRTRLEIETDLHNVAHVLWPLSKENRVTFQERKVHGGESALSNIRLTERGIQTARQLLGFDQPPEVGKLPHAGARNRGAHAVGRDRTDFRQHSAVAEGGPIERRVEKETDLDFVPFVVLTEEEAAPYRALKLRAPNKEHTESFTDEAKVSPAGEAPDMGSPAEVMDKDVPSDTPPQYPSLIKGLHLAAAAGEFPLIEGVLGKRARIERYSKAAELLGDDEAEIAVALLEKIKISPLEEEIIRLLG